MNLSDAAVGYHGRTKPPPMAQHKVELGALVLDSVQGPLPASSWRLENISGKYMAGGDDTLNYRLVFADPTGWPATSTLIVKVWPLLPDKRRREGRPEAGFIVYPKDQPPAWYSTPAYSVVCSPAMTGISAIYFALHDCDFDSVPNAPPLWRLAVDESALLAELECIAGRWTPLPAIHPDPAVDPGVPIERRPQDTPRWYWYRHDCAHYELFKGKLSGSRLFKFIGGGYQIDSFLKDSDFKGNNLTRYGKAAECKIVLAHLLRFTGYTMFECGTFAHPTIADACGTPDAMLRDAERSFDSLPGWLRDLWLKEDAAARERIDWRNGVFEAKSMMYLDKQGKGPEIKPEHICQIYWAMICSGTYWGECARCCDETKQGRVFRIYRQGNGFGLFLLFSLALSLSLSICLSLTHAPGAPTRPAAWKHAWPACAAR
jgi:hypothetical protein